MLVEKDMDEEAWETLKMIHMGVDQVSDAKVQNFKVIPMKDSELVEYFDILLNTIMTIFDLKVKLFRGLKH